MKDIKVTELRSHLSRYLRLASRGRRIVVRDGDEPIAELGPPPFAATTWHDRLARQARLRAGTQDWTTLAAPSTSRDRCGPCARTPVT